MQVLVLSDIHGNLSALQAVLYKIDAIYNIHSCILLGDIIDYGIHSNEVISLLQVMPYHVVCNIWGNHELAVSTGEYGRFSSKRGRECADYTKSILSEDSWKYINNVMSRNGCFEFICEGKRCLAVHGSLEDTYWKSIDAWHNLSRYQDYDYVFSGHSHIPHFFEKFYDTDDVIKRNKKKTIFINPGSTGQPRNHNNMAQYAVLDLQSEEIILGKAEYDIKGEQSAYEGQVDIFYKNRLELGI